MSKRSIFEDFLWASVSFEILKSVTAFSKLEPAEEQYDFVDSLCLRLSWHQLVEGWQLT